MPSTSSCISQHFHLSFGPTETYPIPVLIPLVKGPKAKGKAPPPPPPPPLVLIHLAKGPTGKSPPLTPTHPSPSDHGRPSHLLIKSLDTPIPLHFIRHQIVASYLSSVHFMCISLASMCPNEWFFKITWSLLLFNMYITLVYNVSTLVFVPFIYMEVISIMSIRLVQIFIIHAIGIDSLF